MYCNIGEKNNFTHPIRIELKKNVFPENAAIKL